MSDISPFVISISDKQITDLKTELPIPAGQMRRLPQVGIRRAAGLRERARSILGRAIRPATLANRLNAFDNFKTNLLGLNIHFMHIKSSNPNARPLLLTHGWPGSVVEFLKVIGPLTEPQEHGGTADDAFHQ